MTTCTGAPPRRRPTSAAASASDSESRPAALASHARGHRVGPVARAIGQHQPLRRRRPQVPRRLHTGAPVPTITTWLSGSRTLASDQLHRRRGHRQRAHPEASRRGTRPPARRAACTTPRRNAPAPGTPSSAVRTWPRISASPSTSDSRPPHTRNRWWPRRGRSRQPVTARGPARRLRERARARLVVEATARAPIDLGAIAGGQHERLDAGGGEPGVQRRRRARRRASDRRACRCRRCDG